jgi:hypothetical protein
MKELLGVGSRVKHPAYGDGVVVRLHQAAYEICFMQMGLKMVGKDYEGMTIIESIPSDGSITFTDAEKSLTRILKSYMDLQEIVPIADKWKGGVIQLVPGEQGLQGKDVPIDTFFHKIVMMRDRLRVLEQQINASAKLDDTDKANIQQYITRCYGTMTTFNVLFKEKNQYFVGEKSS